MIIKHLRGLLRWLFIIWIILHLSCQGSEKEKSEIQLNFLEGVGEQTRVYIKKSPLTPAFHFIKKNKKWKLALEKYFPLATRAFEVMKSPGVTEDDWIISLLKSISNYKVDKKIFAGYPSMPSSSSQNKQIDEKVPIGSKVNLHKIGIQDQVIYTLAITGAKNVQTPELQDLKDFQIVNTSKGFSYGLINDKKIDGVFFDYFLKPLRTGTLKIPRQVFMWQGKKYILEMQEVEVVPGSLVSARQALCEKKFIFDTDLLTEPIPDNQAVTVRSKLNSNKIGFEDEVTYTLTITGIDNPSIPELRDLRDFIVLKTSKSSKFRFKNGKSSKSNSFVYYLKPLKTGYLKIPVQVFYWEGRKYTVKEQIVEVKK